MSYVQVKAVHRGNEARFMLLRNYPDKFQLHMGMPLADEFPSEAEVRMDDDYPNAIALVDVLHVLGSLLIVSSRVRALLEARATPHLELLPVGVVNHKGRKVKGDYFIVNLLRNIDCIDRQRTSHVPNTLNPVQMTRVRNLTIDEGRIDPDVQLFRPRGLPELMIARRDLADELIRAGITGLGVAELSGFTS